jgi:glycosyltransferase involved in cell wall biosynthesis
MSIMDDLKLYYIDAFALGESSAHGLQIKNNVELLNKLISITLITFSKNDFKVNKNIKLIRSNFYNKILPYSTFNLIKQIKSYKFEKNSILFTRNPYIAYKLRNKFRKVILEIHDIPKITDGLIYFLLFKFILDINPLKKLVNCKNINLISISVGLKLDLIKLGFNKDFISVLPDAVDLNKFTINDNMHNSRKKLNLPLDKNLIMYAGSFQNWKGVDILLDSSLKFQKNVNLIMVGGSDVELNVLKLKYYKVIFVGKVNSDLIPQYLNCADVLILPNSGKYKISSHYTSPLKLFEYMAMKKPIIASDLPSIREICSDDDVLYFEADNSNDLSLKVTNLLNKKYDVSYMVKNSYLKVKKITWENRVKNIMRLCEK